MALTATVDLTKTPATLTVVSDKRQVTVDVTAVGETVTAKANFPISITNSTRTWALVSDDGKTAVYNS